MYCTWGHILHWYFLMPGVWCSPMGPGSRGLMGWGMTSPAVGGDIEVEDCGLQYF